jgi:hypothetical protein
MTNLLQKAFTEVAKLPEKQQDAMAALLLEELNSDKKWTEAFTASQDKLSDLADEALQEFKEGKTLRMDPDRDFSHDQ